jgi:RNA polymerase sigma-70 factor (ECF subfamily)
VLPEVPPHPTVPDRYADVLERVRAGDPSALDDLLKTAEGIARRYSLAVCGRAADSDDAMQEALLQTFRHAGRIREPRAFRAWLYRTVKNACLIGRRRTAREQQEPAAGEGTVEPVDAGPAADEMLAAGEDRARVHDALARIAPAYREAVFLRDLEGLSTREVASVLRISETNVKVRLHRAHAKLREALDATSSPGEPGRRARRNRTP